MPVEYLTPAIEQRAVEVQALLADRGKHRTPGIPGPLIAATAERTGRMVLHRDEDFDLIAEVTRQPVERLRGALTFVARHRVVHRRNVVCDVKRHARVVRWIVTA